MLISANKYRFLKKYFNYFSKMQQNATVFQKKRGILVS